MLTKPRETLPSRFVTGVVRLGALFQPSGAIARGQFTLCREDVIFTLVVSGMIGVFLGMATGWQVAIESAQVVAGVVEYPNDNPFGMYHLKTWTLLHQVPAVLLVLGAPERVLSMIVGGLAGMISFQALSLCALAAGANRLLAALTPLLLLGSHLYAEVGSVYPVRVLSDAPWVLYGCVGTSLVVLVWSLIGVGATRCGALVMGLAPAIHPTMGGWCLAIGTLAFAWSWHRQRDELRRAAAFLLAGLTITLVSLLIHLYLSSDVPDIPAELKTSYIDVFTANWDSHRKPFPLDHIVVLFAGLAIVISGLWLRCFADRVPRSSQFLLRAILLSGTLGIAMCVATHWQEKLPLALLMAMPGRYINVVGLALPALVIGMLDRNRPTWLSHLALAGLCLYLLLATQVYEVGRLYVPPPDTLLVCCAFALLTQVGSLLGPASQPAVGAWLSWIFRRFGMIGLAAFALNTSLDDSLLGTGAWLVLALSLVANRWVVGPRWVFVAGWLSLAMWASVWATAAIMLELPFAVALLLVLATVAAYRREQVMEAALRVLPRVGCSRTAAFSVGGAGLLVLATLVVVQAVNSYLGMYDWHNNAVYARAHRGSGYLLSSSNLRASQLHTRRPVLLEAPALNQLPYVPESGPAMNRILKGVYGEDLFKPRPAGWRRGGGLDRVSAFTLWREREVEEWQALAKEFGFTQIITTTAWELKLPVVARSKLLLLYEVPSAQPPPPAAAANHRIAGWDNRPTMEAR